METIHDRTALLIGAEGVAKLKNSSVLVFGAGGVGGCVIEGLVRGGVGRLAIVDCDRFSLTNLNRQILSLQSNLGEYKVAAAAARIADIDPSILVEAISARLLAGEAAPVQESSPDCDGVLQVSASYFDFARFDYIVDAIDDIPAKVSIIEEAKNKTVPILSSMGTGNKLDPSRFQITDITKTHTCPLAKRLRKLLKEKGLDHVKVLFSDEQPRHAQGAVGTISFVPSVAGFLIAGEVIRDLLTAP